MNLGGPAVEGKRGQMNTWNLQILSPHLMDLRSFTCTCFFKADSNSSFIHPREQLQKVLDNLSGYPFTSGQ